MAVIIPSFLPPTSGSHVSPQPTVNITPRPSSQQSVATRIMSSASQETEQSPPEPRINIPRVSLPVQNISDDMAAAMTVGLLGHVLFLKNQIPLPITNIYRLSSQPPPSSSGSNSTQTTLAAQKALKKRTDLLEAYDELSCHLQSTFSALSTALALSHHQPTSQSRRPDGGVDENVEPVGGDMKGEARANAYLAIVLGPTVSVPKARVMLALEGLEVKVWGARTRAKDESPAQQSDPNSEKKNVEKHDGDQVEEAEEGGDESENEGEEVPPESDDSDSESDHSSQEEEDEEEEEPSFVQRQAFLAAQTRLLSRTLAEANASEDGGLASDLPTTQTHILIRAPRRFSHPAWHPLQAQTSSLDNVLREFLDHTHLSSDPAPPPPESAPPPPPTAAGPGAGGLKMKPRKMWKGGVKTEGLWVGCEGVPRVKHSINSESLVPEGQANGEVDEEGEMIWWTWNGKLVGFSDW